jgi:hypothetical protein
MSGDDGVARIDQNWVGEAKFPDAVGYLADLTF